MQASLAAAHPTSAAGKPVQDLTAGLLQLDPTAHLLGRRLARGLRHHRGRLAGDLGLAHLTHLALRHRRRLHLAHLRLRLHLRRLRRRRCGRAGDDLTGPQRRDAVLAVLQVGGKVLILEMVDCTVAETQCCFVGGCFNVSMMSIPQRINTSQPRWYQENLYIWALCPPRSRRTWRMQHW